MTTTDRHSRRTMIGVVTSAKTLKTITVEVQRVFKHEKYGKYLRRRKRYLAHDEKREAREGDRVEVESTRPLSKNKRWRLVRVLDRSQMVEWVDTAADVMADLGAVKEPAGEAEAGER